MVEGWASLKSFQPKDKLASGKDDKPDDPGNPTVNFRGQKRSNQTHQSTTDSDLRLFKKTSGSEARLAYQGHVLMENRNGLVVNAQLTRASGTAERETALALLGQPGKRVTLAADKAYDTKGFVSDLRARRVTPHSRKTTTGGAVAARLINAPPVILATRLASASANEWKRSLGWLKTVGLLRKTRHRGVELVGWIFKFATAAYNLVRIRNLSAVT